MIGGALRTMCGQEIRRDAASRDAPSAQVDDVDVHDESDEDQGAWCAKVHTNHTFLLQTSDLRGERRSPPTSTQSPR